MTIHPNRLQRLLCDDSAMGRVSFRSARLSDAALVDEWLRSKEAQRQVHWKPISRKHGHQRAKEWILDPNAVFIIVQHNGHDVGFIQLEHLDERRRLVWLSLIVLGEQHIGKGIGTDALRLLMSRVREAEGIDRILLVVNADNARAIAAYRRLGFTLIDRRRRSHASKDREVDQNIMECAVRWHAPAVCHCSNSPFFSPIP